VATYSAPAAGNHEVLGLLVGESDQAEGRVSACMWSLLGEKRKLTPWKPRKRGFFCGLGPLAVSG
jgi:hypothetical protein